MIVVHAEDDRTTFSIETEPEPEPAISPMPARHDTIDDRFEDNVKSRDVDTDAVDESGWGFEGDTGNADDSPGKTGFSIHRS